MHVVLALKKTVSKLTLELEGNEGKGNLILELLLNIGTQYTLYCQLLYILL